MSKVNVATRERAILRLLRENADLGVSVREIYRQVTEALKDSVTITAYYKLLDRLEASGKIEILREEPERGRIYGLTPTLHAGNPITLDDLYEMLPYVETTKALAQITDAQDYYEENRQTIIRKAAEALLEENPVDLFCRMLLDMIKVVQADLAIIRHKNTDGQTEIADAYALHRLELTYRDLEQMAYRGLSLPHDAIELPGLHRLLKDPQKDIGCDPQMLCEALRYRVFGETFIREINVSTTRESQERQRLTVSGSDGSMHAGTLAIQTAKHYYQEISDIITFNNSIVYVRLSQLQAQQEGRTDMVHSAPFTRQTIDDPSYKGMVLTPSLFPDLSESEYEHMVRCATDVVQFRVDEAVFTGKAYDLRPPHSQIPKPQVHIRDGTIAPQEREFGHYNRPDPYGDMVREGIRLERVILERIVTGGKRAPIFAGAVKSTQMRIFSRLLNWYIVQGSGQSFGAPLEPNWDYSRAASISDNAAMTALLSTLPNNMKQGKYYVTCSILRQFPALTEYYDHNLGDETWLEFFEKKRRQALQENSQYGGALPYHATVDLADDDFVFMCERADFVSFYIGHTAGEPPPTIPRYEFLTSLRGKFDDNDLLGASQQVEEAVHRIVEALDIVGLEFDRDHNFMTSKKFIKILPAPIYRAHEYAKSLGRKLESELKSIVVSHLIAIKRLRASTSDSDVEVRPVSIRRYIERFTRAKSKLSSEDETGATR